MSELKACPFCLLDHVVFAHDREEYAIAGDAMVYVVCLSCGGRQTPSTTRTEALAAWNRRAPSPEVAGLRAEVERSKNVVAEARSWRDFCAAMCPGLSLGWHWDRLNKALEAYDAARSALTPQEPKV